MVHAPDFSPTLLRRLNPMPGSSPIATAASLDSASTTEYSRFKIALAGLAARRGLDPGFQRHRLTVKRA